MKELIDRLHNGNFSCVISGENETRTFSRPGVADLYDLYKNDPVFLKGTSIADKIVGKAAAALMILGGIKEVYADVISLPALSLLQESGYNVQFRQKVPFIYNRDASAWCPMEKLCKNEDSLEVILSLIEGFIAKAKTSR